MNAHAIDAASERAIRRALDRTNVSADASRLAEIWRLGVPPGTEELIDVVDDGEREPVVIRYDLKQAFIGATAILTGPWAGFLGALAIVAGILALSDARKRMALGPGLLVSLLASSPGDELTESTLRSEFDAQFERLTGTVPDSTEFGTAKTSLTTQDVISRAGDRIRLNETAHVNLTVW